MTSYKTLIFAFLFAFALWLYIELNLTYSINLSIPLVVQTVKAQALSDEVPNNIDVRIKGKGWDLLNLMLLKDLKYTLDISKLKKDSKIITHQLVNERLSLQPSVTILEINPDTLSINFDKVSEKILPVKNNINVRLKEGYIIVGTPELNPDSVAVQGSSAIVNKLKSIPTETVSYNNVSSNISGTINIEDTLSNLIKVDSRQVSFFYNIQLSAEKDFTDIDVTASNVPDDKEVLFIPPKVNLSFRGGVEQLSQINATEIKVKIEFSKIENDTLGFVIPEIEIKEEVNLLRVDPPKLQYIIKNKL